MSSMTVNDASMMKDDTILTQRQSQVKTRQVSEVSIPKVAEVHTQAMKTRHIGRAFNSAG